jgi:HSP90 family molecular chaperone
LLLAQQRGRLFVEQSILLRAAAGPFQSGRAAKGSLESGCNFTEGRSAGLLDLIQKKLDANVKQVRLTNRLTTSPACLVAGAEHDDSPFLERLLQRGKGCGPGSAAYSN